MTWHVTQCMHVRPASAVRQVLRRCGHLRCAAPDLVYSGTLWWMVHEQMQELRWWRTRLERHRDSALPLRTMAGHSGVVVVPLRWLDVLPWSQMHLWAQRSALELPVYHEGWSHLDMSVGTQGRCVWWYWNVKEG